MKFDWKALRQSRDFVCLQNGKSKPACGWFIRIIMKRGQVAWMKLSASGKRGVRSCRKLLKFVKLASAAFPRTTVGFETSVQSLFRTQRAVSQDIRFASMDGVTSTNHACSMMQFPARFLDGVICRCGIMISCSKVDRLMSMERARS